jgi:hypothetical protein
MTYHQALAYYNTQCVKLETPFQRGYVFEGYGHGQVWRFVTPTMEEWKKLSLEGVFEAKHSDTHRAFTKKELSEGVWAAMDYYHSDYPTVHKAVEASVAYAASEIQFHYWNKYHLQEFVQIITKWFGAKDYVEFTANGGSLRDFASINSLFKKADEAIANTGEKAPIFWNPRNSTPAWSIIDGNLVVSGLIDTSRGFYKTGTYFHYHYPTFTVVFNSSLEVIEATVTE